ncbi:MAG: septal ring lytic transglycosylase RlpA family protein [Panacagrimonas sp.]
MNIRSLTLPFCAVAALALGGCTSAPPKRPGAAPTRQVLIPPPKSSVTRRKPVSEAVADASSEALAASPQLRMSEELQGIDALEDVVVERDGPPDPRDIPPNLDQIPDPIPTHEPPSPGGNRPNYEVLGQTYKVMTSARSFRETGLASWYGTKFHGKKTSNGEVYDMFELTAAHKQLPLPTYVRITNLGNGKSVIVRVNDRGPFHPGRVIDLSYAAAVRLGTVDRIAMVEVEAITPGQKLTPAPQLQVKAVAPGRAGLLQVAAYSDPINALALREELTGQGFKPVQVRSGRLSNGDPVHRVVIGPFPQPKGMDKVRTRLRAIGYEAIAVADSAPDKPRPTRTARR